MKHFTKMGHFTLLESSSLYFKEPSAQTNTQMKHFTKQGHVICVSEGRCPVSFKSQSKSSFETKREQHLFICRNNLGCKKKSHMPISPFNTKLQCLGFTFELFLEYLINLPGGCLVWQSHLLSSQSCLHHARPLNVS